MFNDLYTAAKLRFGGTNATDSMGQWICDNTTLRKRPFNFEGYEFQRAIADDMHQDMSVIKCSQVGLALALDTPVITPTGWTTMGDLQVGDEVYDEQGQPTTIQYVSPIYRDHDCYQVTFDDGEQIVADAAHRWYVHARRSFNTREFYAGKSRPKLSEGFARSGVTTTEMIAQNLRCGHLNMFSIPNAKPLKGFETNLPIDPYFLGMWLGDGTSATSTLTCHVDDAPEVIRELESRGLVCSTSEFRETTLRINVAYPGSHDACPRGHAKVEGHRRCRECNRQYMNHRRYGTPKDSSPYLGEYDTPAARLRKLGLINSKHIPAQFLLASEASRRDLLRGLIDTDGSVDKRGRVSFANTNPDLVTGVEYLASSLGIKTTTRWRENTPTNTLKCGRVIVARKLVAEVSFSARLEDNIVGLSRKVLRLGSRKDKFAGRSKSRQITGAEPVPSVPVRCISVDSPSHLFLAGKGMIPTHNTEVQIRKAFALAARGNALNGIFSLPTDKMFTNIYQGRMKPILEADVIFNPDTGRTPVRRKDQIQIRDSFLYVTGCSEGDATSTSADFLFHDEVDLSPEAILSLYQSRIQNSDMQITQRFSTPTFLGYGIDKFSKMTDQREYIVRCTACNHYQIPRMTSDFIRLPFEVETFYDLSTEQINSLNFDEIHVKCEHCHRPLDLSNPETREWVATYPTRLNARGYHVRPFSTSRLKPRYIFTQLAKHLEAGTPRHFANTVLGEPYTDANAEIQRGDVEKCMKGASIPNIPDSTPVYMGIDVGFTCHITLHIESEDGLPEYVLFESCPHAHLETRVAELRRIYTIVAGAIDRFPFEPTASGLRDTTNNIIMPVQWRGLAGLHPQKDELGTITHYSANQSLLFDSLHSQITQQKLVLRGYTNHKETVIQHLCDMLRIEQPDSAAQWQKRTGADHFFHSMAFSKAARRISEHMYQSQSSVKPSAGSPIILGHTSKDAGLLGRAVTGPSPISRLG